MKEKKKRNRLLEETLEEMKIKLEEVFEETKKNDQDGETSDKGKGMFDKEEIILELDPPLNEEPFQKSIKALCGKCLEGIPLFSGNMETKLVMEWIEGIENHFEYEGVTKSQKVKVAKSRLILLALTW